MFKWLPCRRETREVTDPEIKRQVDAQQQELKRRIEARIGRDIQYEIEAIRHGH